MDVLRYVEDDRPLSSLESMILTHCLRAFHDGILVGVGTVIADNPSLTTRLVPGSNETDHSHLPNLPCSAVSKLLNSTTVNVLL